MTDEKLTEGTRVQLLAFFPTTLLSMTLYSLVLLSALFVMLWPWGKELISFLRRHQGPSLSFPIFTGTAVLYSYIQFRCGRGELLYNDRSMHSLPSEIIEKREQIFFQYNLFMLGLHTAFFLLPFTPLLILAASVSGLSQRALLSALGLIWMTGILFRISGLLLYRLWGEASISGYLLGRLFVGLFLFLVPVYWPQFSPLRLFYALYKNEPLADGKIPLQTGVLSCLGVMVAGAALLYFIERVVGKRVKQKNIDE